MIRKHCITNKPSIRTSPKQKKLLKDMKDIKEYLGIDHGESSTSVPGKARSLEFEIRIHQLIVSAVIMKHNLINNYLNNYLLNIYCERLTHKKSLKSQNFEEFILQRLDFITKLNFVNSFIKIPMFNDILKINRLRNTMAHSYLPKKYKRDKTFYKNKDIYTLEGLTLFMKESQRIINFMRAKFLKTKFFVSDSLGFNKEIQWWE